MFTDASPRGPNRASFLESDLLRNLDLPLGGKLTIIANSIQSAMNDGITASVRRTCVHFLAELAAFYEVPRCDIRVLAARPLRVGESGTSELFGDYRADPRLIRVWMRTAVRKEVTSFGTFLSTLCHEFRIISTSINTGFGIRGSLVASISAPERSTIVREVRLRNAPARIGPLA